jgi:hypothetical protein
MNINEEILEILTESRIHKDDAICYLLSLYYGYKPTYIPDEFKQRLNITNIYEEDKNKKDIKWNIPLFEGQQTAFEWVKIEYCQMFKETNSTRGGNVREATARLKKLFAKNPDIRKDDVIGATRMYLMNTDSNYIMNPHYFISKGDGADRTETIMNWIDKYRLAIEQEQGRNSISNTMQ